MKTERQKIMEILNSYADEIEGMDFNHIPDYKFNSVANDIINYIETKPSDEGGEYFTLKINGSVIVSRPDDAELGRVIREYYNNLKL